VIEADLLAAERELARAQPAEHRRHRAQVGGHRGLAGREHLAEIGERLELAATPRGR
jgi:hypothetical protein